MCNNKCNNIQLKTMKLIMKWTSGAFSFSSTFERIAKKLLLAQIQSNYSSGDEISSDEETQEDESGSLSDKEIKRGNDGSGTDEDGKFFFLVLQILILCISLWIDFPDFI